MKKFISLILICAMALWLFAGCGKTAQEPSSAAAPAEEAVSSAEAAEGSGMVNPMTEVSKDELPVPMQVPEGATDVTCFTIADGDNMISQIGFTLDGVAYCYRAEPTSETTATDISGMYYDNWETGEAKVDYCEATVMTCSEAAVIYWLDVVPGINYSLGAAQELSAEQITEVANLVFVSAQGEAEGDADANTDLSGSYVNENNDTVTLTATGENAYSIEIGITKLTTFSGEGSTTDGGVEFTVKDPNDGDVYGTFYPAEDGTYSVTFTQSDWELLESNTIFTGFTVK